MITPVARLEVHISNPSALSDLKKAAPARDGLDNRTSGGYTENEKGAAKHGQPFLWRAASLPSDLVKGGLPNGYIL